MVVFPGGGYQELAIDLEGTEVCDWLTSRGITCVLLKYRVPDSGPAWHDDCRCYIHPKAPTALEDAQRTVGLMRFHAEEWHIDPHKIGVLGVCPRFSIRGSRGGSFVINAVNGTTDLSWELLPGKLWHRKVVSVGRFHNPFHQERACYP